MVCSARGQSVYAVGVMPSRSKARCWVGVARMGGEVVAPEAHDIAGEGGKIAREDVKAVHREWLAVCGLDAFAGGLAARRR